MLTNRYIITSNGSLLDQDELYHYGVLGMKWGVRRYQNPDGSLTAAGKKRIEKEYTKTSDKVTKKLERDFQKNYVDSYNKSVDYMSSVGLDKFQADQRKKYGEKYYDRDGYEDDYYEIFHKLVNDNFNKKLNEFYSTDSDVKRCRDLVDKYKMTEWSDFAKKNEEAIEEVRRAVEK